MKNFIIYLTFAGLSCAFAISILTFLEIQKQEDLLSQSKSYVDSGVKIYDDNEYELTIMEQNKLLTNALYTLWEEQCGKPEEGRYNQVSIDIKLKQVELYCNTDGSVDDSYRIIKL